MITQMKQRAPILGSISQVMKMTSSGRFSFFFSSLPSPAEYECGNGNLKTLPAAKDRPEGKK